MKTVTISSIFYAELNHFEKKQRVLFCIISLLASCFLYGTFLLTVRYTFDFSFDEPFFLSICEKLYRGDKLILNEWALSQFTALFQYLPFYLFKRITGSTEGLILFMRYIYIGTSFLMFCGILFKLKNRPWAAVLNAFLFCSFVPLCAFLFGYYYLPLLFSFAFVLLLTGEDTNQHPVLLFLAGILLSCAVLLNPGMAALWVFYCVCVLIRLIAKKRGKNTLISYDFVLNQKSFVWLLSGVLLSAVALLVYLQISCGMDNVIRFAPNLTMDADGSRLGSVFSGAFLVEKVKDFQRKYGLFWEISLFETFAVFVFRAVKNKKSSVLFVKKALFYTCCVVFVLAELFYIIDSVSSETPILMESPMMIALFGLNCMLLCDRRDPKMVVCWLVGAALSFTQDFVSETSCGFGYIICVLPTVAAFVRLADELIVGEKDKAGHRRDRQPKKKKTNSEESRPYFISFVVVLFVIIAWAATNVLFFANYFRNYPKEETRYVVDTGPYKGISMPASIKNQHDNMICDLDTIKKQFSKNSVFIMGSYPFAYLYLDCDINAMSTGSLSDFEALFEKYWQMFPEKRPETIYIPVEDDTSPIYLSDAILNGMPAEQSVDFGWFAGRAIKGKGGLIVRVLSWGPVTQLKKDLLS